MRKIKLRAITLAMSMMVGFVGIPEVSNVFAKDIVEETVEETILEAEEQTEEQTEEQPAEETDSIGVEKTEEQAIVDETADTDEDGLFDYLRAFLPVDGAGGRTCGPSRQSWSGSVADEECGPFCHPPSDYE